MNDNTIDEPNEYDARLPEYIRETRRALSRAKGQLRRYIVASLGIKPSQSNIRRLSWYHQNVYTTDRLYRKAADRVVEGYTLPIPTSAASPQDAYHHTHFIGAVTLAMLRPHFNIHISMSALPERGSVAIKYTDTTTDSLLATENQLSIYQHLLKLISEDKPKIGTIDGLEERVEELERKVESIQRTISRQTDSSADVPEGSNKAGKGRRS